MCGIAGAIDPVERRAAKRVAMLNGSQRHRGPDHEASARIGHFTIANTRLAIQDPGPAGNQPFRSLDGRYHCVFNGEIYNYRGLIQRYELPVSTNCDGEVIPHLWAKLGPASLAEVRGMFAIALVDSLEERLYLARDPFGIKPLYWRALGDGPIVFASEVLPLARLMPGVRISDKAVARYLRFGAMAGSQSPFEEIIAVRPNSVVSLALDGPETVQEILQEGPLAVTCGPDGLESALRESVELHLAADVPTALLLSSGVDSAAIASVGHRLGRRLECLTITTGDATDESAEAAETARHYGHSHQLVPGVLESQDIARFFEAMQRPTIDGLNTYLVSKAVHEAGFKVALSGLGGDEAIGGYKNFGMLKWLPALHIARILSRPMSGISAHAIAQLGITGERKARQLLSADGPRDGWDLSVLHREVLHASLVAELTGTSAGADADSAAARARGGPSSFGVMVAAEVATYLQAMLLPDADTFSMASSVELRVPFVDVQVFAASLALAAGSAKHPGKVAVGTSLDDRYLVKLASQRKRGFRVPMRTWMAGPLAPLLTRAEEPDAPVWSVVDRSAAQHAGLIPLVVGDRWAETWVIAALNAWLSSVELLGTRGN